MKDTLKSRIAFFCALAFAVGVVAGCGKGRPDAGEEAPAAVTSALVGTWEKADAPGLGMRVEFSLHGKALKGEISAAPPDDQALRDFFTEQSQGDAERGAKRASCFAKARAAGSVKFEGIEPTGASTWKGNEFTPMTSAKDCMIGRNSSMSVAFSLKAPDVLVVADATGAKTRSTWKRVSSSTK